MELYMINADVETLLEETFSLRQQRLIRSAVNYHSLIQPGRTLQYKVYCGEKWQYPRLADTSTLNGVLTHEAGLEPIIEFSATSTIEPKSIFSPHYFSGDEPVIDRNIRYILITPDEATDTDVEVHNPQRKLSRIYGKLEIQAPVLLDTAREFMRLRGQKEADKAVEKTEALSTDYVNTNFDVHHPWVEVVPGQADSDATPAVIIGMHWLQSGGAERWAYETVELAVEAGLLPIVITDRDSHQPWISQDIFDKALVINLTMPLQDRVGDATLLRALFEQFSVRGVLVHHCQWLYDNLWWVKKYFPQTPVVDSLHIVEYKFAGGYPRESLKHDEWIDIHHVISPQLETWLTKKHDVSSQKVIVAPLLGLTVDDKRASFQKRHDTERITVAFVGRLARQKRLEAFLLLAQKLEKTYPGRFKFIMHGSGSMELTRDAIISRLNIGHIVELRPDSVPVSQTYRESDVLVVSSVNEGITLTTIEALKSGIPVLSTDVGSQYTLIPPQGLSRRYTPHFVRDTMRSLVHMLKNDELRHQLWSAEIERLAELSLLRSANSWCKQLFQQWFVN